MYLAVLPKYRQECIEILTEQLGGELGLFVSDNHLDKTVRTDIPEHLYTRVALTRIADKAFLQTGSWLPAVRADTTVVDLNPRSVTSWIFLLTRRLLRRRTLVWGHLYPRSGADSLTASLRRAMRKLAAGTITYTYTQRQQAWTELPMQPVWVAPNSLYRRDDLQPVQESDRSAALYVGRLEADKKVGLIVEAFAIHATDTKATRLVIVGSGAEEARLRSRVQELDLDGRVTFTGPVTDVDALRKLYAQAFCSLSPGFAGLGLTQSLGFGVPQIISRTEPHSPEIELTETKCTRWFESDSPGSMATAINQLFESRQRLPDLNAVSHIQRMYSAESMADGLAAALRATIADSTHEEVPHVD